MAEDEEHANALSSAFPQPPPFYLAFTAENLSRLEDVRAARKQSGAPTDELPLKPTDVPNELRFLVPPELPPSGTYQSFGGRFNIANPLPSLQDQGIEQLYPDRNDSTITNGTIPPGRFDRTAELVRLSKSLLLNFLEFVDILATNPEHYFTKIDDLSILFNNIHHLINEYRPHQARETLIAMLEKQLDTKRREIEDVTAMKEKVNKMLSGLSDLHITPEIEGLSSNQSREDEQKKMQIARERAVWERLQEIQT